MTQMEEAFYTLLNTHITYDNQETPILLGYPEIDTTPCITIQTADTTFQKREYVEVDQVQYIRKTYLDDLWINIWCNTNHERLSLVEQVQKRFLLAESNHYSTCYNYKPDTMECEAIHEECLSKTLNNHRSHKQQCPDLTIYKPFFRHNHIIKNKSYLNSITSLDELNVHEPVLRSIIKLRITYQTYHRIGGETYANLKMESLI